MIVEFDIIEKDIDLEVGIRLLYHTLVKRGLGRDPISKHRTITVRKRSEGGWGLEAEIIEVKAHMIRVKYKSTDIKEWIDPIHTHDITIPSY